MPAAACDNLSEPNLEGPKNGLSRHRDDRVRTGISVALLMFLLTGSGWRQCGASLEADEPTPQQAIPPALAMPRPIPRGRSSTFMASQMNDCSTAMSAWGSRHRAPTPRVTTPFRCSNASSPAERRLPAQPPPSRPRRRNSPAVPAPPNRLPVAESTACWWTKARPTSSSPTAPTQPKQQHPAQQVLPIPEAVNVAAVYGIATVRPAGAAARAFVDFVVGPQGQKILGTYGFSSP